MIKDFHPLNFHSDEKKRQAEQGSQKNDLNNWVSDEK
jgi:hypothetical protein